MLLCGTVTEPLRLKPFMKNVLLLVLCVSTLAAGERRSGYFRGKPVSYEVVNGYAITEGDIVLGTAEELAASRPGSDQGAEPSSKSGSRDAIATPFTSYRWTNGVIPYVIESDVPNQKRITDGIQHWIDNTGLQLVARTSETNYVRFSRLPGGSGMCGNSNIGMLGIGAQRINLADDCDVATAIHEIGHAVGLFHEQSRQDRDFYMRVLYGNMDKRNFSQYNQRIQDGDDVGAYDFASIMQYGNFSDSRNGAATVQSIPAGIPFRADSVLSSAEIDAVKRIYSLPISGTTIASYPTALLMTVDGETFRAPKTFNWDAGSRHTLAIVSPQLTGDGVYRHTFARWSDDGAAEHAVTISTTRSVYTAAFSREFKLPLTVSPAGSGTLTVNPPSQDGYFQDGSTIEVTPVPNPGFTFLSWSGFGAFSSHGLSPNPLRINVRGPDTRYNAQFTTANVTRVTSDPPGRTVSIDGQATVLPRNFIWAGGTTHTVNVQDKSQQNFTGTSQYVFRDWSDQGSASHTVTATDKPQTFTADFTTQHLVNASNPAGTGGTVILNPSSPDNFYDEGSTVTLSPTASGQYKFANWAGDLAGNSFPGSVVVDDQKLVTANFLVPKALSGRGLVNAANYTLGDGVAPGEIVTIFGLEFGPDALTTLQIDPLTRRAATTLADTRVLFDGSAAPLIYVSPNQISAVVPYGISGKSTTTVRVEYKGQAANGVVMPVSSTEPALFTFDASGKGPGALLNQNGSVNTADNPAAKGSVVVLYGTGEGATDQPGLDGKPSAVPLAKPKLPVRVRIAGREADILYAGAAPGLIAGVLQINVRIPADSPAGAVPVQLLVGDRSSPQNVTIAVQ
jgi:uncharacterized protein (TIGR03437 family)